MIEGLARPTQALLATLLTWAVTALGSAVVFLFPDMQRKPLDASLGFAAGVMMAASYWSLLEPSIETAKSLGYHGNMMIFPTSIGFLFGALFVMLADHLLPSISYTDIVKKDDDYDVESLASHSSRNLNRQNYLFSGSSESINAQNGVLKGSEDNKLQQRQKKKRTEPRSIEHLVPVVNNINWKRIMLLIIAITVHNIPEGLAVGVSFGSIGRTETCTFAKSRNLAIGIAIQNFPEGLAVSVPLRASGVSSFKAFWYGQLSGLVEPVAGVLGAVGVSLAEPSLPYVLAFAAGAMVFVVFDDIIPEAHTSGNGRTASLAGICGFLVMMALDVILE